MSEKTMSEKIEAVRGSALAILNKEREILSAVYVHSPQGEVAQLPYDGSPEAKSAMIGTLKLLKAMGILDFAVLLSEAWMAKIPEGVDIRKTPVRASESPDREEVVIARVVCASGEVGVGVWPIIRAPGSDIPSLGEPKKIEAGESWLDRAVKEGEKKS